MDGLFHSRLPLSCQTLIQSGGIQCKRARAEPLTVPDVVLVMQPLYDTVQDDTGVLVNRHKLLESTLLVTTGVV